MTTSLLRAAALSLGALAQVALPSAQALAFCGFYVARADSTLFNRSSKVVLARDGQTTAITMASDYQGSPKEFALVIPVPTVIERKAIGVVDMKTIDHLDAFTAPRLVEYTDEDPCRPAVFDRAIPAPMAMAGAPMPTRPATHGVTVEASYDVAEYDVQILSAQDGGGLVAWLTENGYRIPDGAEPVIGSYLKQNMHFFVAKVNLDRMTLIGAGYLRPLQVRYASAKFMLPLRLGTVNAAGPQDLVAYVLSRRGRVEPANYRTVKVPSDAEVPLAVKTDFGTFYRAVFDTAVKRDGMASVFTEYAWDLGWCDPCAADPMKNRELVELGARWIGSDTDEPFGGRSGDAYVTRLHVRYDRASFPEDIAFTETADRDNFQGRYILRHPWTGEGTCPAAQAYRDALPGRLAKERANLARLTGAEVSP